MIRYSNTFTVMICFFKLDESLMSVKKSYWEVKCYCMQYVIWLRHTSITVFKVAEHSFRARFC